MEVIEKRETFVTEIGMCQSEIDLSDELKLAERVSIREVSSIYIL